jgi:esterase/lipase superfamily enzyme
VLKEAKINVVDLSGIATDDRLGHSTFAESPDIVRSIGARIARGQDFTDKGGIGDKITQATTSVASTVGSTAGLVISAPLAIVDGRTRDSLGDQINSVGSGAADSFGAITTVGGVTLY